MTKYRVILETGASVSVTVEANDEEEAIERAFEDAPSEVCAQCSGWGKNWNLDLAEWATPHEIEHGHELDPSEFVTVVKD